ncbi:MAG: sulfotransferase [Akkermansiaceae bacterium]
MPSHPQAATTALAQGNVLEALRIWKACADQGASANELAEWGHVAHQFYQFDDAEYLAAKLALNAEVETDHLLQTARLFFQVGRFSTAAKLTSRASLIQAENPDILTMLASCTERAGDDARAIELLKQALALDPSHARAVRLYAHIERRDSRFSDARTKIEQHLLDHPSVDDWRLQYELAAILDRLGEYDNAMEVISQAKNQLQPQVPMREAAMIGERQWQVTQLLSQDKLSGWRQESEHLSPRQKICLMAGFPRSGTTLLESVLTGSDNCVGTDETGILATLFEKPLVLDATSAEDVMEELDHFEPEDLSAGREEYLRCTEQYIGKPINDRWLIEKEPLLTSSLAVPLRLFPDAKIIMPLRDPRDVVISYYFTLVPLAANCAAAISLGDTCQYYASVMRHWIYLKQRLPESQWLESRYEDLIADPETQTKKLASFLGIKWSDAMLNHHKNRSERNVSTPTYDDVSKPLYTRSVERWKNYEAQLTPHLHHLEPYIAAFGYDT